jgi:hypothetical protein
MRFHFGAEPEDAIYCQCTLRKGDQERVTWLPAAFARVGNELRLRGDPGWIIFALGDFEALCRIQDLRRANIRRAGRGIPAPPRADRDCW